MAQQYESKVAVPLGRGYESGNRILSYQKNVNMTAKR